MLLLASIYEIYSQSLFFQKNYKEALIYLKSAQNAIGLKGSRQGYYIEKWYLATQYALGKIKKSEFTAFQKEMKVKREFETYRDCDFILALLSESHQSSLLKKLYFGTPFEGYKKRVLRFFPEFEIKEPTFLFKGEGHTKFYNALELDPLTPQKKEIPVRMLSVLFSDHYKPFSLTGMHAQLFPGEYFSPYSSQTRVRQALFRSRKSFLKKGLLIEENRSLYSLLAAPHYEITLKLDLEPKPAVLHTQKDYTIRELAQEWDCSVRTALRRVKTELEAGRLSSSGKAKATRYTLITPKQ